MLEVGTPVVTELPTPGFLPSLRNLFNSGPPAAAAAAAAALEAAATAADSTCAWTANRALDTGPKYFPSIPGGRGDVRGPPAAAIAW